ncbi:hypothetical protein SLEP1_g17389 [Rubroshorea leprosula]|uniref:Uncharacterized protein n=1 Tax=Rubroshorea leprosula TaxID=152421 RepID=A0AAV5J2Y9_9ROSI|nr:hypothetical protein SLEP1_g17389 [Rubroshorea leprosula]
MSVTVTFAVPSPSPSQETRSSTKWAISEKRVSSS